MAGQPQRPLPPQHQPAGVDGRLRAGRDDVRRDDAGPDLRLRHGGRGGHRAGLRLSGDRRRGRRSSGGRRGGARRCRAGRPGSAGCGRCRRGRRRGWCGRVRCGRSCRGRGWCRDGLRCRAAVRRAAVRRAAVRWGARDRAGHRPDPGGGARPDGGTVVVRRTP
ncbi:MAG: hypothetical protein EPO13_04940 [Actinomycetota bacterium]|nr:MAG: hypothetical protein EPO13_04940 [Actinomycetota bacterium]